MPNTLPVAERMSQDVPIQPEVIEPTILHEGVASPDGTKVGNEGVNQEAEEVFSRAHSDGQEFSGTLEQARKVCPALGRMSLENARTTLQEGDLAERVAQRGREKRQAEIAKTDESKAHSDKPVNGEKASTKLEAKQIEYDDDSRSIAETTLVDMQHRLVHEAVQTKVSPEPVITAQRKDTHLLPLDSEMHDFFMLQAESVRLSQATTEIRDEIVEIAENEDIKAVKLAAVVEPSYSDTLIDEGSELSRQPDEIIRRIVESVEEVISVHTTDEKVARPVFVEEISKFDVARPDAPEQRSTEYHFDEVEQTGIPISIDEPLYETRDGQVETEPAQLAMTEETESVELQENLTDYELLGEDEVILLMADFEQSKAEIDQVVDSPIGGIITAGPSDNEFIRLASAEFRSVVSVPELPSAVKEIETALMQLTEVLELAEANEAQKVYQILEEIITLPNGLEASAIEAEKAIEKKLEELFVRLFEQTGAEYTPELIESFVKLTQEHYLKELLPITIETEDDIQTLPDEIGTREFLQKLQHSLTGMKQTVVNFYEIGRSVLRLYGIHKTLYRALRL